MVQEEFTHHIQSIHEVATAMNSTLDPDELLDLILDRCIHICGVHSGSLMLIDEKNQCLSIASSRGINPSVKKDLKLKLGEGVTGRVAETGKARLVNDVKKDIDYISIKEEIKSELAVPMLVEDIIIGVISLDADRINAFNDDHLEIVSILAKQAAQIFKNLQTFRKLDQKNKVQQVLMEIARIITSTLDLNEIFNSVMNMIEKSLKLEKGSIILYQQSEDLLKTVAGSGLTEEEMDKGVYKPGEGITGQVFDSGTAKILESLAVEKGFLNKMGFLSQFKHDPEEIAFLSAPIQSEQSIIGVINVFFVKQKYMELTTYLDFLQIVASFISQAIRIHGLVDEAKKEISRENTYLKRELKDKYKFGSMIGKTRSMDKLFEKIKLVSESKASVLITGESGTGKEMIASAIHYNSNRADKPFIKINCAAIPDNLLESELFGYKKGSFTGASIDKKGKFEIADTGTIFLDEIGELDLNLQSKILRVLQEKEVEAVGSLKPKKVDVRVIAATNADLEDMIEEKTFRPDLYYRLNVVNMHTPSLRERKEDIPLLVNHFIEKYSAENGKKIKGVTREAHRLLAAYPWPGNVRELENIIERAVVLTQNEMLDIIDFSELSDKLVESQSTVPVQMEGSTDQPEQGYSSVYLDALDGRVMEVIIGEIEQRLIRYAMKKFRYTKTRVAKFLGINRNTLDKKIKELKIEY